VLGAGVAIFSAIGVAASRSGAELQDLSSAFGVLAQPMRSVAASVGQVSGAFDGLGQSVLNNIDTALIAAGMFAAYMGGKFLVSTAMATASTATFTGAMYGLGVATARVQAILARFLPFAVLLGLAKAVEMFLQLRNGAGSTGEALSLLRDVGVAAFQSLADKAEKSYLRMSVGISGFKVKFLSGMQAIATKFDEIINKIVDRWNSSLGDVGGGALRLTVGGSPITDMINAEIAETNQAIADMNNRMGDLSGGSAKLAAAISALRLAYRNGGDDVRIFGEAISDLEDLSSSASGRVQDLGNEVVNKWEEIGNSISSSIEGPLMAVVKGTMTVKDAFRNMAASVIEELYRVFVVKQITGFIGGFISGNPSQGIAPIGGLLGQSPAGLFPSFDGGGYTGIGSRSGGLDGRGGFMAMVHPRESIVDHTRGGGSGVTVVQNINISAGVSQTVRAEMMTMAPMLADQAKNAVLSEVRSGGSYAASMRQP
jgi:methyl-accepting chemotaxis protein